MKYRQIVLIALFTFGVILPVQAADIAAGKATAIFACAECHGINGISVKKNFQTWPDRRICISSLNSRRSGQVSASSPK